MREVSLHGAVGYGEARGSASRSPHSRPLLLLAPWGGLLADRMSKRNILIVTATAAMIPSILLGVLTFSHHINVVLVLGLALIGD